MNLEKSCSEEALNAKHKALTEQIKAQKESVAFVQTSYNEYPADTNANAKAYLENSKKILQALEGPESNKIYYEVQNTGTSKTLLGQAPLKEQRTASGHLSVAKNAPALRTIQLLQMRQPQTPTPKVISKNYYKTTDSTPSLWSRFKSLFTPTPGPGYQELPQEGVTTGKLFLTPTYGIPENIKRDSESIYKVKKIPSRGTQYLYMKKSALTKDALQNKPGYKEEYAQDFENPQLNPNLMTTRQNKYYVQPGTRTGIQVEKPTQLYPPKTEALFKKYGGGWQE